jgi:ribonuclease J
MSTENKNEEEKITSGRKKKTAAETSAVTAAEGIKEPSEETADKPKRKRRTRVKTEEVSETVTVLTEPKKKAAKAAPKRTVKKEAGKVKGTGTGEEQQGDAAADAEIQETAKPVRRSAGRKAMVKSTKKEHLPVRIIPLGGLEQIGMNMTAFQYGDTIIVVDCGLAFPEDDMLGVDLVLPDTTFLEENLSKVKGFVITHGHEDHIGAIPYVLKKVNVPIYATRLTMGLIESKLTEHDMMNMVTRNVVKYGQTVTLGDFKVEFIRTNHSISDSAALAITCPAGVIVHTGDFKVDFTPVYGDPINLQRFGELGHKGVLALLCDSTNVLRQGFTSSEKTIGKVFEKIFTENQESRLIIATFASNVDRVQQIINTAVQYHRKVCVEGRSMVNIINVAQELGYLRIPDGVLIQTEEMINYRPQEIVLITTGSQGETMAALSRMAADVHRKVQIRPGDVVVFSSNPIPGNEKSVAKVINELGMKGAKVIFQDTHVSGHACQEEIKLIYTLVKPKFAFPVHGEYRHLQGQHDLAKQLGYDEDHIIMAKSGDVVEITDESAKIVDHVQAGRIMVDGLGVGDVGNIVLRDRQNLAENGIVIVVMTLQKYTGNLVAGPDIISRGFVYVREAEDLLDEAHSVVEKTVDECLVRRISDWSKIKNLIKDDLSEYFWKKMHRHPVILPIIMEEHG